MRGDRRETSPPELMLHGTEIAKPLFWTRKMTALFQARRVMDSRTASLVRFTGAGERHASEGIHMNDFLGAANGRK